MSLTLYTFIQVISEQLDARRARIRAWKRDQEAQEPAAAAATVVVAAADSYNKETAAEDTEKSAPVKPVAGAVVRRSTSS